MRSLRIGVSTIPFRKTDGTIGLQRQEIYLGLVFELVHIITKVWVEDKMARIITIFIVIATITVIKNEMVGACSFYGKQERCVQDMKKEDQQDACCILLVFFLHTLLTMHGHRNLKRAYRVLVESLDGYRPLGRHRRRWEDNIKIYI